MNKSIKVGELEVPIDYFALDNECKRNLCLAIIDTMITLFEQHVGKRTDVSYLLNELLNSSIQSNEEEENYEVCQVLKDIKQIINE